mmetsp:Transcript_1953/g.2872  ORF Transcript_1953/g.2872 Transcript_1953/m.2872 type:complete len:108 (-) Transcript_1953:6497-6820(-)
MVAGFVAAGFVTAGLVAAGFMTAGFVAAALMTATLMAARLLMDTFLEAGLLLEGFLDFRVLFLFIVVSELVIDVLFFFLERLELVLSSGRGLVFVSRLGQLGRLVDA